MHRCRATADLSAGEVVRRATHRTQSSAGGALLADYRFHTAAVSALFQRFFNPTDPSRFAADRSRT